MRAVGSCPLCLKRTNRPAGCPAGRLHRCLRKSRFITCGPSCCRPERMEACRKDGSMSKGWKPTREWMDLWPCLYSARSTMRVASSLGRAAYSESKQPEPSGRGNHRDKTYAFANNLQTKAKLCLTMHNWIDSWAAPKRVLNTRTPRSHCANEF